MTSRAISLVVTVVVGVALLSVAGLAALTGAASACPITATPSGAQDRYDTEQLQHAGVIVTVGVQHGVPVRGQIIAVATAMQESGLRSLGHLGDGNDHDSLGLFQQRPSQGWGTPAQLLEPEYAAGAFYRRLLTVPGWQTLPLTAAAQAVQRSAYPGAYARWEPDATALVALVTSTQLSAAPDVRRQCNAICAPVEASASGAGDACAGIDAVFARARSWLTAWSGGPVPYLSSNNPAELFRGYRRDCSGYVSMALGLPGPGLNTIDLAGHSTIIARSDLRPGDLMINPDTDLRGHVVLFAGWADASMSSYHGFEQTGVGGTHYRTIPYPYFGTYEMTPYRLGRPK